MIKSCFKSGFVFYPSLRTINLSPRLFLFMLNSIENEISTAHKNKNMLKRYLFTALTLSDAVFYLLKC